METWNMNMTYKCNLNLIFVLFFNGKHTCKNKQNTAAVLTLTKHVLYQLSEQISQISVKKYFEILTAINVQKFISFSRNYSNFSLKHFWHLRSWQQWTCRNQQTNIWRVEHCKIKKNILYSIILYLFSIILYLYSIFFYLYCIKLFMFYILFIFETHIFIW